MDKEPRSGRLKIPKETRAVSRDDPNVELLDGDFSDSDPRKMSPRRNDKSTERIVEETKKSLGVEKNDATRVLSELNKVSSRGIPSPAEYPAQRNSLAQWNTQPSGIPSPVEQPSPAEYPAQQNSLAQWNTQPSGIPSPVEQPSPAEYPAQWNNPAKWNSPAQRNSLAQRNTQPSGTAQPSGIPSPVEQPSRSSFAKMDIPRQFNVEEALPTSLSQSLGEKKRHPSPKDDWKRLIAKAIDEVSDTTPMKVTQESSAAITPIYIPPSPAMGGIVHHRPILTLDTSGAYGEYQAREDATEIETSPEPHIENFPSPNTLRKYGVSLERVLEIWDSVASKYKLVRLAKRETIFPVIVMRKHIDRISKESTIYVDMELGSLGIVGERLKNVKTAKFMKTKASISEMVLLHFLPELECKREECIIGYDHLSLLKDYLNETYSFIVKPLIQKGEITYDLLEALFKPGCYVYSRCPISQQPRCVVFAAGKKAIWEGTPYFKLECYFLDYDGYEIRKEGLEIGIAKFNGRKLITTLEAFPLQYHPHQDHAARILIKRGRKLSELMLGHRANPLIRYCRGNAFSMVNGKVQAVNIDSCVAVDARLFREMEPDRRPIVDGVSLQNPEILDGKNEYLIRCPTVCCFSFNDKMFLQCAVDGLEDVQWAFNHFKVARDKRRRLLLETISHLCGNGGEAVDFVHETGQGLNAIFFGVPGFSKTFLVEATPGRPLYSVSASELVTDGDPSQLDSTLDRIFRVMKQLNAVLLITQADALTEKRSYQDDCLVTIFLRKLEYYKGSLFLATDRVIEIDHAIMSRIHLKIEFPDPNPKMAGGRLIT
ncbi:uncharacterized protein TRUGW13939_07641 [Talaromyces rugulosus]|uniref:Uncharacterized protein n=1 Tax=Talaromyces rugulosus TaxID=121627 RepID=A0A7H8R305_TALRU|nr:uncharacterized protein TRUGW13939_07641 [Talaromyces rugulosus]QKX60496.1 hypothetical protein TRUGW13939_07641 [Talaromyces rugulosus]